MTGRGGNFIRGVEHVRILASVRDSWAGGLVARPGEQSLNL